MLHVCALSFLRVCDGSEHVHAEVAVCVLWHNQHPRAPK